jgi:hypothetical protein
MGIQMPKITIQSITGLDIGKGNSPWAWVAMGLDSIENGVPGYFNGYNQQLFETNDYDYQKTTEAALESITNSFEKFYQEPEFAAFFFGSKLTAEWANSSFESLSFQEIHKSTVDRGALVTSAIIPGGKLNALMLLCFDLFHAVVLFGVLLYLTTEKSATIHQLFFVILFIGGFIFFLFWEAKARYVLPFFFLLIPYAYPGYRKGISGCKELISAIKIKEVPSAFKKNRGLYIVLTLITIMILFILLSNSTYIELLFKTTYDNGQYYNYMEGAAKDSWIIKY